MILKFYLKTDFYSVEPSEGTGRLFTRKNLTLNLNSLSRTADILLCKVPSSRKILLHGNLPSDWRKENTCVTTKRLEMGNENKNTRKWRKGQFPVSGIFGAGGILDTKKLLSRNDLLNFRATFSLTNNRISARSENSTDWKSALMANFQSVESSERAEILLFTRENVALTLMWM